MPDEKKLKVDVSQIQQKQNCRNDREKIIKQVKPKI